MPFSFKVWNQGNDGQTMGIRVEDVDELANFAGACIHGDAAGNWNNLTDYIAAVNTAVGVAPPAYSRLVDVAWLNPIGYGMPRYFPGRTLVAIYTGNERASGGFAAQCYCIVDPIGYPALAQHHRTPLSVLYIPHTSRDLIVVQ